MVAVPLPSSSESTQTPYSEPYSSARLPAAGSASFPAPVRAAAESDWTNLVAAGAVVAGGALMVTGHKRAGLAVAAAGTVLALLDEPEAVGTWWRSLPRYLNGAQDLLDRVEGYLEEANVQGQRLKSILRR